MKKLVVILIILAAVATGCFSGSVDFKEIPVQGGKRDCVVITNPTENPNQKGTFCKDTLRYTKPMER